MTSNQVRNLNGLVNVNIELTSRCNKNCWICGRRKIEKGYPALALKCGDMPFESIENIVRQLPSNIVVQLHNNGEALLYPKFGEAVKLFGKQITNIVTNGKLLLEKADEIINNLDTMAISIFENDSEADEQFFTIKQFLKLKGKKKPYTILRINGKVEEDKYKELGLIFARRALHSPMGSFNYRKIEPTIPEIGICLDFLSHLAINISGDVSICVRLDPEGLGIIGNINEQPLDEIWTCEKRMEWLKLQRQGRRSDIPLCTYCHFWGVPTSENYKVKNGN